MHLTLRFLGEIPDGSAGSICDSLGAACAPFEPFVLETAGLGCFPLAGRPRVIWLGLAGNVDALGHLAAAVTRATDEFVAKQEDRPFAPHLTLGRIGVIARADSATIRSAMASLAPGAVRWPVKSALLIKSVLRPDGAEHLPVGEFSFGHPID